MTKINKNKFKDFMSLDESKEIVVEILEDALKSASSEISHITNHLATADGKGIRTNILLVTALNEDGLVNKDACYASVAVELLHLATLVHDDVIDNAPIRRGIESVQSKFGKRQAVIAGDYLFCRAFSTVSHIYKDYVDTFPDFSTTMSKICLGELRQYKNNWNVNIDLWEYLRIINGKTAALFYLSAYIGSVISKSTEKEIDQVAKFGNYLGMIFQIIDDCKDYKLTEGIAKKPVKSDLSTGVITLPLIMTLLKKSELREMAKEAILTDSGRKFLIDSVYENDGVNLALSVARKYEQKATKILKKLDNKVKREELNKILNDAFAFR